LTGKQIFNEDNALKRPVQKVTPSRINYQSTPIINGSNSEYNKNGKYLEQPYKKPSSPIKTSSSILSATMSPAHAPRLVKTAVGYVEGNYSSWINRINARVAYIMIIQIQPCTYRYVVIQIYTLNVCIREILTIHKEISLIHETSIKGRLNLRDYTVYISLLGNKSPSRNGGSPKSPRSVTWNSNVPEKYSFTMRREFERAKEEADLIEQLRNVSIGTTREASD
jgi:hypothetical protein